MTSPFSPAEKKTYDHIQSFRRNLPPLSNAEQRRLDDLVAAGSSSSRLEGLQSFLAVLKERLQRQNEEILAEWNNNQNQFPSTPFSSGRGLPAASPLISVGSPYYGQDFIRSGGGFEEERAERARMLEEELAQGVWEGQVKDPARVLPREGMKGPVWDRVSNSATLRHYTDRGWDVADLALAYDNMPEDIKNQYDTPRTTEELFHILKNQRKGRTRRRS